MVAMSCGKTPRAIARQLRKDLANIEHAAEQRHHRVDALEPGQFGEPLLARFGDAVGFGNPPGQRFEAADFIGR
jgi:hypothetical protein